MKFSFFKSGQLCLLLAFGVLGSSCNKEDFFKAEEFLFGEDAYCFEQGPDLASCLQLPDRCRPAYLESEDETKEPEFFVCLANPTYAPPSDGGTTGGTDEGTTTGGTDEGTTTGGTDEGTTGGTDGGTTGGTDEGTTTGGTDGGTTGGTDGGTTGGTDEEVVIPPTIEETVAANCSNLSAEYLWTKKVTSKNGAKMVSKVKVCHKTGNGSAHTIVIACPALKSHVKHHDDTIGTCIE